MRNRKTYSGDEKCKQYGFSLVEMAVVLVIIGLLVGGVMQGQSLIRAAKVRDIITTASDLTTGVAAFKDRYGVLPGDSPTAVTDIQGAAGNGNGDGLISVAESANVPNHLFYSGFIKGGAVSPIKTTYGSVWLVQRTVAVTGASPCGVAINNTAPVSPVNNMIVFSNIPSETAEEIDAKLDDGLFNSGSIRGSSAYTSTTPVCLGIPL